MSAERGVRLYRVRWRAPYWAPTTGDRVRLYCREHAAWAAADRLAERGYVVQLARADRAVRFEIVHDDQVGWDA